MYIYTYKCIIDIMHSYHVAYFVLSDTQNPPSNLATRPDGATSHQNQGEDVANEGHQSWPNC